MLTVGQELWMVPRERYLGQPRAVRVTKVGRLWAQLDERGYRVCLTSLAVDGGGHSSPAQCYVSREAYEAEEVRRALWRELRQHLDHNYEPPELITSEQIKAAALALGRPLTADAK